MSEYIFTPDIYTWYQQIEGVNIAHFHNTIP